MHLQTKKQKLYYDEVIRLHLKYGYGEDRISKILPIGHATVSRWIAIFVAENKKKTLPMKQRKPATALIASDTQAADIAALQLEVIRLQAQLKQERLRADAYDEMIHVAESKFNIAIRKKAGAKR
jgi:transposase